MEKRILKEIAKRWCKGVLMASEAAISFEYSGLTDDETEYIQGEIGKIADRITPLETNPDTDKLVAEYLKKHHGNQDRR